jgi:hypothetical protein
MRKAAFALVGIVLAGCTNYPPTYEMIDPPRVDMTNVNRAFYTADLGDCDKEANDQVYAADWSKRFTRRSAYLFESRLGDPDNPESQAGRRRYAEGCLAKKGYRPLR